MATAAFAVVIMAGGSVSPDVPQVAQLALASSTMPAPAENRAHPGLLVRAVDGVTFPYREASQGWRAAGERADTLQNRRIVTVFYASRSGTRVGYSIVAGSALPSHDGTIVVCNGVRFRVLGAGRLHILTWLRSGHTCVLTGHGISQSALLRLATGRGPRSLPT